MFDQHTCPSHTRDFSLFISIRESFYAGRNVTKRKSQFWSKNEFSQLGYSSTHVLLTDSIYSIGKVLSCTKSGRAGAVIKALIFASTRLSMPFNIEHWVIRAAPAFTWVKDTKYMKEVTHEQLFKWKKAELYLFCSSLHSWKFVERTLFFVSSAASLQLTWALLRWHTAY